MKQAELCTTFQLAQNLMSKTTLVFVREYRGSNTCSPTISLCDHDNVKNYFRGCGSCGLLGHIFSKAERSQRLQPKAEITQTSTHEKNKNMRDLRPCACAFFELSEMRTGLQRPAKFLSPMINHDQYDKCHEPPAQLR